MSELIFVIVVGAIGVYLGARFARRVKSKRAKTENTHRPKPNDEKRGYP